MRSELNKALGENWKLEEMFNPDQLVQALTNVVSNMTVKGRPKTSQCTQYKGTFNYVGRQRQPSWHVVLKGCSSQMCPATIARTQDPQMMTVSA